MEISDSNLDALIRQKEKDLRDKQEELDSQRGMLSAAIDELVKYNNSLTEALNKLKQSNSELERLLYHSSHGLRSPLNSIQGIINLLGYEPLPESTLVYVNHIDKKVRQMIEIMSSLTTLAVIASKEKNSEAVYLQDLVKKQMDHFNALAKSNNVTVSYRNHLREDQIIQTDPFLLTSILKQVIMNGLIFRDSNKPGHLLIDTRSENNKVSIRIEDDGDGIAPDIQSRIFEMFYRGSEKSGGSGLGLFIAKKSTELLGGTIEVTSADGRTVFSIQIPG